jgi:hypothetical protein
MALASMEKNANMNHSHTESHPDFGHFEKHHEEVGDS